MLFDDLKCFFQSRNLEVSGQNIVALIFLTFSLKCSCYIIVILRSSRPEYWQNVQTEAVAQRCSVKKVFLKISQNKKRDLRNF